MIFHLVLLLLVDTMQTANKLFIAQSAGAVEYTDCTSAEG